jgi:prophage tail gpP-like protein
MPNPAEICVVTALGQRYDNWQTVEIKRDFDDVIDHAMLTVAEISTPSQIWSSLKLKPGDTATVLLAGQKVIDGKVYLRQAVYDKGSHSVQIGIWSESHHVTVGTVDAKPGQYKNSTLQQIGAAVFGKVGVGFNVVGSPAGADKIFPRVNETVGETRFCFIERLCRMRNLYMIDDGQGNISAVRGPTSGSACVLQEGRNILRARLILKNNEYADTMTYVGQDPNAQSGDLARGSSASVKLPPFYGNSAGPDMKIVAPHPGDSQDMAMLLENEAAWMAYQTVDGDITVQGWMLDDGSLWFNHVRDLATVNSPMLLPENSMKFMIKGIVHKQSNEDGTTTEVLLARQDAIGAGGGDPLQAPAASAPASTPGGQDT